MAVAREKKLNLNEGQRYIISEMLKFPFEDITQALIDDPVLLEQALLSIESLELFRAFEVAFVERGVRDNINFVFRILAHQYPQNTSQTNGVVDARKPENIVFKLLDVKKRIKTRHDNGDIELKNGRIIKKIDIDVDDQDKNYIAAEEPQGLLSLTTREDNETPPATKEDVVNYIHDLIAEVLVVVRSIPDELKTFFKTNAPGIRELMQGCGVLGLKELIEIGAEDLNKLLFQPAIVALLLKRAGISVKDFINLEVLKRDILIDNHKAVIKLNEEGGLSWDKVVQLKEALRHHIFTLAPVIARWIKNKKIDWQALNEFSAEQLPAYIFSQLTVDEIGSFITSLHREALLTRFFLNGPVLVACLRKLDLEKRMEVISRIGTKLCYLVRTRECTAELEECLEGRQSQYLEELKARVGVTPLTLQETLWTWEEALLLGNVAAVRTHLSKGVNVNEAVDKKIYEVVGVGNNITAPHQAVPIEVAALEGHTEIVEILVLAGAEVNNLGSNLIDLVLRIKYIVTSRALYELGVTSANFEKNNSNRHVQTEIDCALNSGDIRIIHDLHECGLLKPNHVDYCMSQAIIRGRKRALYFIPTLVRLDAKIQEKDYVGAAVREGNIDAVRLLLDAGAPVDGTENLLASPLVISLQLKSPDQEAIISLLLERGAKVDKIPDLIRNVSLSVLKLLLDAGLNPNKHSLLDACMKRFPDPVSKEKAALLIRYGANVPQNRNKYKLKQLQMLLVYNENVAFAQCHPSVHPDVGFIKAFWQLYGETPKSSQAAYIDEIIDKLVTIKDPDPILYVLLIVQLRSFAVPRELSLSREEHGWHGSAASFNANILKHNVAQALANYILGFISRHHRFSEYIEMMMLNPVAQAQKVFNDFVRNKINMYEMIATRSPGSAEAQSATTTAKLLRRWATIADLTRNATGLVSDWSGENRFVHIHAGGSYSSSGSVPSRGYHSSGSMPEEVPVVRCWFSPAHFSASGSGSGPGLGLGTAVGAYLAALDSAASRLGPSGGHIEVEFPQDQRQIENLLNMLGIQHPDKPNDYEFLDITCEEVYRNHFERRLRKSFERFQEESKISTRPSPRP